jgi:hypothetical protein
MTIGSNITAAEFVTIQNKAESLLGPGAGTRGYNQTVVSSDVFSGNQITRAQWDLLKTDIINILYHQNGELPNIVTVNSGDVIQFGAGHPNSNYDTLLETAAANRFQVAASQSVVTSKGAATYTSAWSSSAQFTLTITFATADQGRYFFNSGGKIRINTSISGGSGTAQYNAWVNFLNSVGIRSLGADTDPLVNYYTLTNSFQTYYQSSLSTPYSANNYRLEARTNVANNSTGTATILTLRATLTDAYTDPVPGGGLSAGLFPPGDSVDGTLTISVEELKASGILFPSGSFSITGPASYSLSGITAS